MVSKEDILRYIKEKRISNCTISLHKYEIDSVNINIMCVVHIHLNAENSGTLRMFSEQFVVVPIKDVVQHRIKLKMLELF